MFCSACGNKVADDARFCEQCGSVLAAPAPAPQPAPQPTPFLPYEPTPAPCPVMEPAPVTAPAVPESPVAPVKKKKKILPRILILAVVVIAVVIAVLLFGKKTVYLMTESVTKITNGSTTTMQYKYDDDGRIVKYKYKLEYPDSYDYTYDTQYEISYKYDKDGKLESAEFESGDKSFEVEYIYKNGVLTGFACDDLLDDAEGMELEIECDDEGRFEYIGFLDEDGNEYFTWKFKYYGNGIIKYARSYSLFTNVESITKYNEDGKTIEHTTFFYNELRYRQVYDYDDRGNPILLEQYDENDELVLRMEAETRYRNDKLDGLTLLVENDSGDEAEIVFDVEWDDWELTLTADEIDGDESSFAQFEDMEIILEKDEHGNTVKMEMIADGRTMQESTTKYQAFRVSRKYEWPNIQKDPLYLYFLFNL